MAKSRAHKPTEEKRGAVSTLAAMGMTVEAIAERIGITKPTLYRYYRADLERGKQDANVKTARSLFDMANGRPARFDDKGNQITSELKPNVTAAIFWMKCRAGWIEEEAKRRIEAGLINPEAKKPEDERPREVVYRVYNGNGQESVKKVEK